MNQNLTDTLLNWNDSARLLLRIWGEILVCPLDFFLDGSLWMVLSVASSSIIIRSSPDCLASSAGVDFSLFLSLSFLSFFLSFFFFLKHIWIDWNMIQKQVYNAEIPASIPFNPSLMFMSMLRLMRRIEALIGRKMAGVDLQLWHHSSSLLPCWTAINEIPHFIHIQILNRICNCGWT